jgi:capsular exopolysaccharide synthesis family protein
MTRELPVENSSSIVSDVDFRTVATVPHVYAQDKLLLEKIIFLIWFRKWSILFLVLFGTTLTSYIINQLTPRYTATSQVVIDVRPSDAASITAVLSGRPANRDIAETEVDVMMSRELAKRVIKKLNLSSDPEFAPWLRPKSDMKRLSNRLRKWIDPNSWPILTWLTSAYQLSKSKPESLIEKKENAVVANFLAGLNVATSERSFAISINYESADPGKAALIANAVASEYMASQVEAKFDAAAKASTWLVQQVDTLRDKVRQSQEAVERYRQSHDLVQASGQTIVTQQLSELNTRLVIAQTDLSTKEAQLRNLRMLSGAGRADSAPEALASPLIQQLRERETDLLRREGELLSKYGERHPLIVNIRNERKDLNNKISEEINRIVVGLENEVEVARQQEATLRAKIADLENRVSQGSLAEVTLKELQREADANQQLFETFLSRYKQTSVQDFQQPDARILSQASAPLEPSFPKKSGILALSGIGFFSVGVLLALVRDRFENGFRSVEEVEQALGFSPIGAIPKANGLRRGEGCHRYLLRRPASAYSEACRTIWTTLALQNESNLQCVLVTSAVPNEGKTSFVASLGCTLARIDYRVVVIDADFRRPNLTKITQATKTPSLADLLLGNAALNQIISQDAELGISVIPAADLTVDPLLLLNSSTFFQMIDQLRLSYDVIIIDAAPILAAPDSLLISKLADAVLMLIRYRTTSRSAAVNALAQLIRSGSRHCSTVLTCVTASELYSYNYASKYYKN